MNCEQIAEVTQGTILFNEIMRNHTTYKIGGEADFYISPKSEMEIEKLIKLFKTNNYPFYLIGNGSNLLVSDSGYRGAIIDIKENFSKIEIIQNELHCGGGALITKAAYTAAENSLSGFEEIAGIPGTVGGALVMNAGCYGKTISEYLKYVEVIDFEGNKSKIKASELKFAYRQSGLENTLILKAVFSLSMNDKRLILDKMNEWLDKRRHAQPLSLPSCGSVFKRPEGHFAGKLIEDSGLKGYTIGGAMVSKKHAGFIINFNRATATDVIALIDYVKQRVNERFGVILEEEVIFLGF